VRLLYTHPTFWPYVRRGSERLVHDLSLEMSRRGHEVTLVTSAGPDRPRRVRGEGFEVAYRGRLRGARRIAGLDAMESFALTAAEAGLREPGDVNHAFYLTDAYGLTLAARARPRPVVFSWHGVPGRRFWEQDQPRTHRWYMRMARRAACITVMTEASAQRLREDYDYDPVVLTPGIFVDDYNLPRAAGTDQTIVCASALDEPRKRLDLLLRAFANVAVDDSRVRLMLVGYGNPDALLAQVAAMPGGIRERIRLDPAEDLASVYTRCSVGALTSVNEPFGLVVLEYLAAGMPAVVTATGGAASILTPGAGATFVEDDVDACAAALRDALTLAADPSTAAKCRDRAREFDWSRRGDAYESLYQTLA
jgi:glycosyltransferase involved in cell wall biosynthesis